MTDLNNIDVIILITVGISALIALSRGLVKEVLSIIGWVLGTIAVIYLLPVINPLVSKFIDSGFVSGIVTAMTILILFMLIWTFSTTGLIKDIRKSKLSVVDRVLGLFFGIIRAFLLVVLVYIMVSWITPEEKQSPMFKESKYYQLAGKFAKPIESLIPQATLDDIRKKAKDLNEPDEDSKQKDKAKSNGKPSVKKPNNKVKTEEAQELFEKLAQPKIKKKISEKVNDKPSPNAGYDHIERKEMDDLIESAIE